ncbi:hypothetical protein CPB83DRAFT_728263, partial [Crepidotus variabilis]
EQEEWDDDEDYDEDDDEDIDKEAQEIARRLGEQLWADISKVNAERSAAAAAADLASTSSTLLPGTSGQNGKKVEAALSTMKAILALVEKDPQARAALLSITIPNGPTILDILHQCATSGHIQRGISGPLSQVVVSLAKSEALFGNLKESNAPAIQLDIGKRKREAFDEGQQIHSHAFKRPYVPDAELQHQILDAIRIISQTLGSPPSQDLPSMVSPVRLQLHQVFLFAVTSASIAGPNMHSLQEIGGLIQVVGVLSGIQIGHTLETQPAPPPFPSGYPWSIPQPPPSVATDIGTAVYPCLVANCGKVFSRLYSLRAHQRSHAAHRPYRCNLCPASFARNHDLKRHVKLHDQKAWKCQGCNKVFSRRDAIKRHKTGTRTRGPRSEICLAAEVVEVELEGAEADAAMREERRAKLWNGIAVNEASEAAAVASGNNPFGTVDEGEINPAVIFNIQSSILGLHGLLQALVGNTLGNPVNQTSSMPVDPSAGHATLASVIARAQSQNGSAIATSYPQSSLVQPLEMQGVVDVPVREGTSTQPSIVGENVDNLLSLSMYGLSDEQTKLLEVAIANAASAAQAQAEAEAALEEEAEDGEGDEDGEGENEDAE